MSAIAVISILWGDRTRGALGVGMIDRRPDAKDMAYLFEGFGIAGCVEPPINSRLELPRIPDRQVKIIRIKQVQAPVAPVAHRDRVSAAVAFHENAVAAVGLERHLAEEGRGRRLLVECLEAAQRTRKCGESRLPVLHAVAGTSVLVNVLSHRGLPRRVVAYLGGVRQVTALIRQRYPIRREPQAIAGLNVTPWPRLRQRRSLSLVDRVDQPSLGLSKLLYCVPLHGLLSHDAAAADVLSLRSVARESVRSRHLAGTPTACGLAPWRGGRRRSGFRAARGAS